MPSPPEVRFLDRTTPPHILTLVLLAGIGALAMNVFLPSLPAMAAHFGADYAVVQLSVSLYLAVNALLQLFIGPISDRYGRRPVMLAAIALFLLATLGTLLAPTVELFLACRALQAVIVAGLVLGRAVVRDMVPEAESASMIGYVTMGMALVPMVGPVIGGFLDQTLGWKANFWLLFLCGAAILALAWFDMGETAARNAPSLGRQLRDCPELLTSRRFWGYCAAAALASGAFFAFLGGAPYVGTEVFGLSPALLGLYFGAPALGYAAGNFLAGRYSVRVGINRMVLWGALAATLGLALLLALCAVGLGHPAVFFGFIGLMGLGNGIALPNATAGMLSVRPQLAGTASGLGGAIMIGGGAALSALAGALLAPGAGPFPLLWLMVLTSAGSILAILYVIRRERRIGLA